MYENENKKKTKQTNQQKKKKQSKNEIEFILKTKLQTLKNDNSRASE